MTNLDLGYDALGNLTSKSDVGSYSYDATKKHAVVSAGSNTYSYDANGNVTNRSGSTVLWTSYDLPLRIYGPDVWTHLHYGPNRQLWQQVTTTSGVAETTTYVGELIEKVNESGVTTWKHYVEAPTGTAAVYLRRSDGTADTYYLTHDHLGSIDKVLNAAGGVVTVAESFTALGARRGSDWQGLPTAAELAAIAATTRAGFTGHDMLDSVGLIHMRGRVYDPLIGRFLSVDPRVRDITAVQSWNGYGYVEGRALSATDPSGFELEEIFVDSTRLRSCVNSFDVGCGGDVEQRFGFDLRTPGYRDLLYDPGSFTEPGREAPAEPQEDVPPCSSIKGPSINFVSQIGAYGSAGIRVNLLGLRLGLQGELNLFSYNTPTSGRTYWSRGLEGSIQVGRVRGGVSWEQRSYDGGFSFESQPTNFLVGDLNGSTEGTTFEVSPPQFGAGFTSSVDNPGALLPAGDTPICR